jgi:ech hydrogenase subunit A
MTSSLLVFLIVFPLAVSFLAFINRKASLFAPLSYGAVAVLAVASLALLGTHNGGAPVMVAAHAPWVEPLMLLAEVAISAFLLALAIRQKDAWVGLMVVIQAVVLMCFHFHCGKGAHAEANLFLDLFSVIMGLIIGIIGGLIAVYAVGYMKDFCHHHPEIQDRRAQFFGLIFLFLSGMFGLCFSNNLLWMLFFWEITTVCSFLLIRYKMDDQSVRNAFWALRWNLLGGLAFLAGIIYLYHTSHIIEMDKLLALPKAMALLPVALLCFAGMTKAAQLPFSSWLVGAMVAPTPVSALLHSSTMVKAGVYLVLRFATTLEGTTLGFLVAMLGIITFLVGSFICISQRDAKKVLAYSTIANLGLIILCAGIGTYESVWAGILLIIFHAISKGLLFLCVGTIEHNIHSRNIEDMTGLIFKMPYVAVMAQIGIAGMFLAPFGMLISKWAVLRAIVDYNPLLAVFLVFGSAATLFFWVKWLGQLIVVDKVHDNVEGKVSMDQWVALGTLAVLTILICGFFSPVAKYMIEPYVLGLYGRVMDLGAANLVIMSILMLTMVVLFPIALLRLGKGTRVTDAYLAGANTGDRKRQFTDSMGSPRDMAMGNYYMEAYFSETRLMRVGVALGIIFCVALIALGGF